MTLPVPRTRDRELGAFVANHGRFDSIVESTSGKAAQNSQSSDIPVADFIHTRLIAPRDLQKDCRLVYVVHSRVQSRPLRDAVRKTWAQDVRRLRGGFVVFLLGYDGSLEKAARDEADTHGDILQYDLAENYRNLAKKSILMLMWAGETLSEDSILVKTDDDVLVNVYNLQRTLETLREAAPRFLAGNLIKGARPVRDPAGKWFVPLDEYAGEIYPPYLAGCLYVISGNLIHPLLGAIPTTKIMAMEDVYITGILGEKSHSTKVGLRGINSYEDVSMCDMHGQLARHYLSANALLEYHHFLKTTTRICEFRAFLGSCRCVSRLESILSDPSLEI